MQCCREASDSKRKEEESLKVWVGWVQRASQLCKPNDPDSTMNHSAAVAGCKGMNTYDILMFHNGVSLNLAAREYFYSPVSPGVIPYQA